MTDIEKAEMLLVKARFPFLRWDIKMGDDWFKPNPDDFPFMVEAISGNYGIAFESLQEWPYPPETRDGMQVWWRYINPDFYENDWNRGVIDGTVMYSIGEDICATEVTDSDIEIVAADPRNLKEPPK